MRKGSHKSLSRKFTNSELKSKRERKDVSIFFEEKCFVELLSNDVLTSRKRIITSELFWPKFSSQALFANSFGEHS